MRRFGQKSTGLVEDALTLGAAQLVMKGANARLHRQNQSQAGVLFT